VIGWFASDDSWFRGIAASLRLDRRGWAAHG
jgi:hypothetical protein